MKKMILAGITVFPLLAFSQKTNNLNDLSIFPKPENGIKKAYFNVPKMKNEENLKIEIIVGKEEKLDCNNYFLMGKIKEEVVNGWGYSYYVVESDGKMGGTLMACLDGKKELKFVTLESKIARYNSKLPYVVYVPKDFKVKYKVLNPSKEKEASYTTKK